MSTNIYIANVEGKVTSQVKCSYADTSPSLHYVQMSNNAIALSGVQYGQSYLSGMQSVTLGTNVLSVTDRSFQECSNLMTFQPNDKLKHIGSKAFYNCSSLKSFSLPNQTTYVGDRAFMGCSSVQEVTFSYQKTLFGDNACRDMSSLQAIAANVNNQSGSGIFRNDAAAKTAAISGCLTESMFRGCTSLQEVTCYGISDVPQNCFRDCTSLTSISFQKAVKTLGQNCFYGCKSLSELDLSHSKIVSLPNKFLHGTMVSSLVIPSTLAQMNSLTAAECSSCFDGMSNLSSVTFNGMDDDFMQKNKKKFTRFGCDHNFIVYSKDKTKYQLNKNGIGLRLSDSSSSINISNIWIISIAHTGGNLVGMWNDIARVCGMVKQATDGTGLTVTYKKLGDGGDAKHHATALNVMKALDEGIIAKPDLLVFHFSDHGKYGNASQSGTMTMESGSITYQYVVDKLTNSGVRAFILMCCCYPFNGVTIPDKGFNALVWCGGTRDQVTYMDDNVGHDFITCMVSNFSKSYTYEQLWKAMSADTQQFNRGGYNPVSPQQYVCGKFNVKDRVFM